MKILAKTKFNNNDEYYNRLPLPSQVKRLGKFLSDKKNLTGVYKVLQPPNEYVIYTTILYQIPAELRKKMKEYNKELKGIEEDIYEANIYLNITTYGQYIRVNVILLDDYEKTLGFLRFDHEDLVSLPACKQKLLDFIYKKILKYFEKYEVLIWGL